VKSSDPPILSPLEQATETRRLIAVSRDSAVLRPLWSMAESNSWQLETVSSAWEALERIQSGVAPHLFILDVPRCDRDGLHTLRWLRRLRPELPIILVCHSADADHKKDAIRMGADEVLVRPFQDEHLGLAIHRLARFKDAQPAEVASENIESLGDGTFFVSASPLMQKLRTQAELLAEADIPVLILGEKGSGKETAARLIHRLSVRSGFRFLKVNCGALPGDLLEQELFGVETAVSGSTRSTPGKFEIADKGTLLIDDLTEMPNHLQARLRDVLQNRRYARVGSDTMQRADVRVLAATSANLEHALAEKRLREDLYYRLSEVTVHVPPLRKRKEEVRVLLRHFMHCQAKHYGLPSREFSPKVVDACQNYSWPGNLAELKTFVKRYLVAGESNALLNDLDPKHHSVPESERCAFHLPASSDNGIEPAEVSPQSLKSLIHDVKSQTERSAIGLALEKTGWNRKAAARLLRVSYRSLLYKIEQYQMKSSESFVSPLTASTSPHAGVGNKSKLS